MRMKNSPLSKTVQPTNSEESEDVSLGDSLGKFGTGEEARQRRAERQAVLRREQTQRAEEEAHKKDDSILEFEKELLARSRASVATRKFSAAVDEEEAHKKTQEGCTKRKVFKYLVLGVAWWDLVMDSIPNSEAILKQQIISIMTEIHIQSQEVILESILLDKVYNCVELHYDVSQYMRVLCVFHGCTSLLLMYSLSTKDAQIMVVWFFSKAIVVMIFAFRVVFDMRLQEDEMMLQPKRIAFAALEIMFYCIEYGIVIILYVIYKKPNVARRRKLQSSRPLNRDIYLKGLSPFMQRKHAVRWAERLQACIVLQKIRDRDEKPFMKKKDRNHPTDEELAAEVEMGVLAFRKANNFDVTDIDDRESKTTLKNSKKAQSESASRRAKKDP